MDAVILMAAASVLTGLFVGRTTRREGRPAEVLPDPRPEVAARAETGRR